MADEPMHKTSLNVRTQSPQDRWPQYIDLIGVPVREYIENTVSCNTPLIDDNEAPGAPISEPGLDKRVWAESTRQMTTLQQTWDCERRPAEMCIAVLSNASFISKPLTARPSKKRRRKPSPQTIAGLLESTEVPPSPLLSWSVLSFKRQWVQVRPGLFSLVRLTSAPVAWEGVIPLIENGLPIVDFAHNRDGLPPLRALIFLQI